MYRYKNTYAYSKNHEENQGSVKHMIQDNSLLWEGCEGGVQTWLQDAGIASFGKQAW